MYYMYMRMVVSKLFIIFCSIPEERLSTAQCIVSSSKTSALAIEIANHLDRLRGSSLRPPPSPRRPPRLSRLAALPEPCRRAHKPSPPSTICSPSRLRGLRRSNLRPPQSPRRLPRNRLAALPEPSQPLRPSPPSTTCSPSRLRGLRQHES